MLLPAKENKFITSFAWLVLIIGGSASVVAMILVRLFEWVFIWPKKGS